MKKVFLLSVFMIMLFASFVIAEEHDVCDAGDDNCKIDKAYSCLREEIDDKECENLSPEEKVFSLLAVGKCKSDVLDDSKYRSDLKYTAQALIGFKETGSSVSSAKDWLFDNNRTSIGIDWLLEIESPEATTCSVDYSNSNNVVINEDKTIDSITGSGCLSLSSNGYWLEVNPECYDEEFEISCDQQFLTTLLYKGQNSDTIYVSEKTSSSSSEGITKEQVRSSCFGDSNCDYEGTLWSALALNVLGSDITPYLPYLITMKDKEENEELLSEAFLYSLTGGVDFKNQLLSEQINSKWWVSLNDRYYGTALALYPFQYEEPLQKKDAIDWLLNDAQEENGCWDSGNIRNTAFLLYSISPSSVSLGGGDVDCEDAGFFCSSQINCNGQVLSGYSCSGSFVCCSEAVVLETCSEQGGEICNSNQNCIGTGSLDVGASGLSAGQVCCLSGVCQEPKSTINACEEVGGNCRVNSCNEGEETTSQSCDFSSDICCIQKQEQKTSYGFIWVLFLLIVIVVLGIVFRDKLRPYWFRIKSRFGGSSPPRAPGPGAPPPTGSPLRRVAPRRRMIHHPPEKRPLRRMPRAKSQSEIDEVLKKLKEMGS